MRTGILPDLTTAQAGVVKKPKHVLLVDDYRLSFDAGHYESRGNLDYGIPQSWLVGLDGGDVVNIYAAFRDVSIGAECRVVRFPISISAGFGLRQTAAVLTPSATMRAGLGIIADVPQAFWASGSGAQVQLYTTALTGTGNPITVDITTFGSAFGPELIDSSTLVRRVEAVCPVQDCSGMIVAIGTHRFVSTAYYGLLSTIEFWYVTAGGANKLDTIIQTQHTSAYTSIYEACKWASHVSVADMGDGCLIVANAHPNGRAVSFTFRNGIESEPTPVIATDIEHKSIFFTPNTISEINDLYYLTGRVLRLATVDGEASAASPMYYDCYLTSVDGVNWSLGERNYYLFQHDAGGTLFMSGTWLMYAGNGFWTYARGSCVQDPVGISAWSEDIIARLRSATLEQTSNGADQLTFQLSNWDGYFDNADMTALRNGALVKLQSGQYADVADIGIYGIDKVTAAVSQKGRKSADVSARDIAGKMLVDWRLNTPITLQGRSVARPPLTKDEGLILKTQERSADKDTVYWTMKYAETDKLKHQGLNDPAVLFVDAPDTGNGITRATVRFGGDDAYHLSSLGILIGATDDGRANVFLLPKGDWKSHAQARVHYLNLNAVDEDDPEKEDTGWNLKPRINGLWESALTGDTGKRSLPITTGTYLINETIDINPGSWYDVMVRAFGRRAQMWVRYRDMSKANCADNAQCYLISDFEFPDDALRFPVAKTYGGITLATDVFVDPDAFAHACYDDVEVGLSSAGDLHGDISAYGTQFDGTWNTSTYGNRDFVFADQGSGFDMTQVSTGQKVRVHRDGAEGYFTVTTINTTPGYEGFWIAEWPHSMGDATGEIVLLFSGRGYAYCASGTRKYSEFGGALRLHDPQAVKSQLLLYGAGCVYATSSDANTTPPADLPVSALSKKDFESDGVLHLLVSAGWDGTWPGGAGTDPVVWSLLFQHNAIARYWVSEAHDLGTSGSFLIDDEAVGYVELAEFTRANQNLGASFENKEKWTVIPTCYTSPVPQTAVSQDIYQYWNGSTAVGDAFDGSDVQVGMIVELFNRKSYEGFTLPEAEPPKPWYVKSKAGTGATAYIKIGQYDEALGTIGDFTPETVVYPGEIAVTSFRGRFGTTKTGHSHDAPVVYLPCDATGNPAYIQVKHLTRFSGRYMAVEDAVRRACALAGMRLSYFRKIDVPYYALAQLRMGGTTPQSLGLRESLSNFVLNGWVTLPGRSTDTNGFTDDPLLVIDFRGYYRLVLQVMSTADQIAAGYQGNVRAGLITSDTGDVDVGTDGHRWLEWAVVPVSPLCPTGDFTGAHPDHVYTPDFGRTVDLRVTVRDALVGVELNGQQVWTFDLDVLYDGVDAETGTSYRVDTAGDILVSYNVDQGVGASGTFQVIELAGEIGSIVAEKGDTARSIIDQATQDRHVRDIATQDGGRLFSQFWARDDGGAIEKALLQHTWTKGDAQRSLHQEVAGQASGEAMDTTTIQAEGYQYGVDQADIVDTVEDAVAEARLKIREQAEYVQEDSVNARWMVEHQPEDQVAIEYLPSDDLPSHASSDHVITSISATFDRAGVKADYALRLYKDVPAL